MGAVGSPRILQIVAGGRSPIHLGKIGVPVVHEARGVGKNMQNTITPASPNRWPASGPQRTLTRSGLGWRSGALALHGQRDADIQPLHCRRLVQGIGGDGDPRPAGHLRAGTTQGRADGRGQEAPGLSADAGRCCHCRAAMSRPSRTTRATRQRSTRAICRKKATGAPSSVACALRGSCSPRRRSSSSLAKRPCPAPGCRATTNCSTTHGAPAAPAITPVAPA